MRLPPERPIILPPQPVSPDSLTASTSQSLATSSIIPLLNAPAADTSETKNVPQLPVFTLTTDDMDGELGNQDVRIVMLTTESNPKLRERGKAVGVNGWIVKPFKGELVLGSFRKICGLS